MNFVNASNLPRHVKPILEEYGLHVETKAGYDDVYSAETGLHETILLGKKGSAEPFNIYVKRGLRAQTAVLYFGTVLRHAEKENVKPLCISDRIVGSVAKRPFTGSGNDARSERSCWNFHRVCA